MDDNNTQTFFNHSDACYPFKYPMAFVVYGIISPIVFSVALFTNILVIAVFTKKKMRSPTTSLLIGLAISDTLTGGVISYTYIYIYGLGHDNEPMKYPMCIIYDYTSHLSSLCHTISIWITTYLGVQRYIIVAFPFIGPRFCTIKVSIYSTVFICVMAIAMYLPKFLNSTYSAVLFIDGHGVSQSMCICPNNPYVSENIVHILRGILGQIIPCTLLIVTTFLLVRRLKKDNLRKLTLQAQEKEDRERKDFRQIQRTSQMIVMIVVTFIVVELPNGIVFAVNFFDNELMPLSFQLYLSVILNLMVYVSFIVNFWIYICLSAQFRRTLSFIISPRYLCLSPSKRKAAFDSSCRRKLNSSFAYRSHSQSTHSRL